MTWDVAVVVAVVTGIPAVFVAVMNWFSQRENQRATLRAAPYEDLVEDLRLTKERLDIQEARYDRQRLQINALRDRDYIMLRFITRLKRDWPIIRTYDEFPLMEDLPPIPD